MGMNIGLLDVGSGKFPNLPLMKISAWHKAQGDSVEFVETPIKHYDRVYVSKIFGDEYMQMPDTFCNADEIVYGGTGFAISVEGGREVFHKDKHSDLPAEIEHIYPDYSLYPELTKNKAYGFLTRGCPNNCAFCLVSKKEGVVSTKVADLSEWWNGQRNIILLDPNILACRDRKELLQQLIDSGAWVEFNQGLDARFITPEIAEMLAQIKTKMWHLAFDFMKNEDRIIAGLQTFVDVVKPDPRKAVVYMLTNFDTTFAEDWYRLDKIRGLGLTPDVRIYRKSSLPRRHILRDLQRWCNNRFFYQCGDFWEFIPRVDLRSMRDTYPEYYSEVTLSG